MPTTIETSKSGYFDAPRVRVFYADVLFAADWIEVPYLRLNTLRMAAAPDIDVAEFEYVYGAFMGEDRNAFALLPPKELNNRYCKIEIEDTTEKEPRAILWHGIFEVDSRDVLGSDEGPTGVQTLVAYGLLRLLEKVTIDSSMIRKVLPETETVPASFEFDLKLGYGLPFNVQERGIIPDRGNRSAQKHNGVYVFSQESRTDDKWTAKDAVEYLLKHHQALTNEGNTVASFELRERSEHTLDWYDIAVQTDMRSVKEVLDELINRRRGVGYYCFYDEEKAKCVIDAFSFNDKEIPFDTDPDDDVDHVIGANPDQLTLNFERSVDIEKAVLRNLITTRYDRIVAQGNFKTSTATYRFTRTSAGRVEIVPDWTQADEALYREAASERSGYEALSRSDQERRNAICRSNEDLRSVYCRWRISSLWSQTVRSWADPMIRYYVNPRLKDEDGTAEQPWADSQDAGRPIWNQGFHFLPWLIFRQGILYDGTAIEDGTVQGQEYDTDTEPERPCLRPMVFLVTKRDSEDLPSRLELIDQLSSNAYDELDGRNWAAHVQLLDRGPLVQLLVSPAGAQHFLAKDDFDVETAAAVSPQLDPTINGGVNWTDLMATLTAQLPERVREEIFVFNDVGEHTGGTQERVLYINVSDARLDYVVPDTVCKIEDGAPIRSTGGHVRDDRPRLKRIAYAAQEWYGKTRQSLMLRFKQVRRFGGKPLTIGDLITSVGEVYSLQSVNSPITAIMYEFAGDVPVTTLETSYADLDLSQ